MLKDFSNFKKDITTTSNVNIVDVFKLEEAFNYMFVDKQFYKKFFVYFS